MTSDKFLPYSKQSINDSDILEVTQALKQELITRGKKTENFEAAFAERLGAKYAVTFTSATTALYAAAQAVDVSSFDRFVTTPNSFVATAAAGMRLGAKLHFVDIEKKNGNINVDLVKEALAEPLSRGRHIISPVHFAGSAVDLKKIDRAIKSPQAVVIEDAAHALGSKYPTGELVGSCPYSQMTVFSFHAIKTLTTGEGGAVTTNDEKLYHRLKRLRNSGMERSQSHLQAGQEAPWYYEVQELSANYHMTEMQAALGLSQLRRLDQFVEKRAQIADWYRTHLKDVKVEQLEEAADERSTYHLKIVLIDFDKIGKSRTKVMQALKEKGIGTQYHYIPIYRHPALAKQYGHYQETCPVMESYYKQALSIPFYYELEENDVRYVARCLKEVL